MIVAKELEMRFVLLVVAMVLLGAINATAQPPKKKLARPEDRAGLKVGTAAPNFELADADGKNKVTLECLKGKPVVLVFGSCT